MSILATVKEHPYWVGGGVLGVIVLIWLFWPSSAQPQEESAATPDIGPNTAAVDSAAIQAGAAQSVATADDALQTNAAQSAASAAQTIGLAQADDALKATENTNTTAITLAQLQAGENAINQSTALAGLHSSNATQISLATIAANASPFLSGSALAAGLTSNSTNPSGVVTKSSNGLNAIQNQESNNTLSGLLRKLTNLGAADKENIVLKQSATGGLTFRITGR